jgi:hypothetical protein
VIHWDLLPVVAFAAGLYAHTLTYTWFGESGSPPASGSTVKEYRPLSSVVFFSMKSSSSLGSYSHGWTLS